MLHWTEMSKIDDWLLKLSSPDHYNFVLSKLTNNQSLKFSGSMIQDINKRFNEFPMQSKVFCTILIY